MKDIVVRSSLEQTIKRSYEVVLTETLYNALLKKYGVEPVVEELDSETYKELPTFQDYYELILNPRLKYQDFPYEPRVKWHYWKNKTYEYPYGEYSDEGWKIQNGFHVEAGYYSKEDYFGRAIKTMLNREWALYCHKLGYKDNKFMNEDNDFEFSEDEECIIPFENNFHKEEDKLKDVDVDIPDKKRVEYYE